MICSVSARYVILENDFTDIAWLLKDLEKNDKDVSVRYQLASSNLKSNLSSMDTEYDKNSLKAVLFATGNRKDITDLGIKADNAVNFLQRTVTAAQECDNALEAAEDMLCMRISRKRKLIETNINQIDAKISRLGELLPENRKNDLLAEKDVLAERSSTIKKLQTHEDKESKKRFNRCKKRQANNLVEEHRVKRRRVSSGAPRALDSEDEEFIVEGRRHDAVSYVNHRVKKKDFLTIANYSLFKRGKKLMRSGTTVQNRARPKNKRSRTSKLHLGKGLFCAKKPPKTEQEDNECTHHQRKHIKNAKSDLFSKVGLVVSMNDKVYLRPGTDVGFRNTRAGKIYDVSDKEKSRKLPQHDFSTPEVHVTPSSFRVMTGHQEVIDGKLHLVNDTDQTIVTVRPKYFIGSSGSLWASETMMLRRELLSYLNSRKVHIGIVVFLYGDFTAMFTIVFSIFMTQRCMSILWL